MCARLTQREQEILLELARGYDSNKALARHLGITLGTLEGHLVHIHAKLGTKNQVQLVRWAFREALRASRPTMIVVLRHGRLRRTKKLRDQDRIR